MDSFDDLVMSAIGRDRFAPSECPECEQTAAVVHRPGFYPVCTACGWTGWQRDEVEALHNLITAATAVVDAMHRTQVDPDGKAVLLDAALKAYDQS